MNKGRGRRLRSLVEAAENFVIVGHVLDLEDPEARLVVELWVDGWPLRLARAELFDADLFEERLGDGCYGFRFVLEQELGKAGGLVEARLANSGESLGEPFRLETANSVLSQRAEARWTGGLRISGWLEASASSSLAPTIRALVDGETAAEARADHWTRLADGDAATVARAFVIDLPPALADGRARAVRVVDESGRDLPGSPVTVLAFADGLERYCLERADIEAERPRGAIFDAMFARAHPFRDYRNWAHRFPPSAPKLSVRPKVAVALIGDGDPSATLQSLEAQLGCDWVGTVLAGHGPLSFEPEDLRAFLAEDASEADFVVIAPAGAIFAAHALGSYAEALATHPAARIVYGDLTFLSDVGAEWPVAFPAFDHERMLEQGYAALCFAARRGAVEAAATAGASDPYSLLLSSLGSDEKTLFEAVAHCPGFLCLMPEIDLDSASAGLGRAVEAHLAARKTPASTEATFSGRFPSIRVRRKPATGRVSVIVTTRDSAADLGAFLDAFAETTSEVTTDLLIVDLDSATDEAIDQFAQLEAGGARIAHMAGPAHSERGYNSAANIVTGDFLLFCDDDMLPLRSGWLAEMLGRMAENHVGAVTPTFVWPTGAVQQCGMVVGPDFAAARAFRDIADGDLAYGEMMASAHEVGAATSAGLLTRRADFLRLGGFDVQRFGPDWACVDYALRLRAAGSRIIASPYAKLSRSRLHHRPAATPDDSDRERRALETLRYVWGETLANDALYNPLLALSGAPFSALAWPPRDTSPRWSSPPRPKSWPDGI